MTTGSPSDYSVAVTSWNNEKDYYNYDTNVCQTGKVCGHYTQVKSDLTGLKVELNDTF